MITAQTPTARKDSPARADGGRSSRNERAEFACPRCHHVVDELRRITIANIVSYLETSVCAACVHQLRALAGDCDVVEELGCA